FGYYDSILLSYEFPGSKGFEKMQNIMKGLRENPLRMIGGFRVVRSLDYLEGIDSLPKADVLKYFLEEGTTMVIRPSGTEPKLKIYLTICGKDREELQNKKETLTLFADGLMNA
ncbi:MAG: phospho-sugar mutase, partial [Erysipelotrichaceae bacterium]|nr:phospho-sugar mutase [Erysipelotrichaceae bacterium]